MASGKENSGMESGKLEKWREAMSQMSLKDLLKIKYCYNKHEKWQLMYSPYDETKKKWFCTICRKVLMDSNAVLAHNGLNKHKSSLETKVYDIFHDNINPFKSKKEENPTENAEAPEEVDFKAQLLAMSLEEILEVRYKINELWKKLIIPLQKGYNCTICKSNLLTNIQGIRNHMSNRQHKSNMELIAGIHHPKIFPTKDPSLQDGEILTNKQQREIPKDISKEIVIDDVQDLKSIKDTNLPKAVPIQVSIKSIEKKPNEITNQNLHKNEKLDQCSTSDEKTQMSELETISQSKESQPQTQLTKNTINEFLSEMTSMRKEDLIKVEYKGNDRKWKHIITYDGIHYSCGICNLRHLKDIPLSDHIKGRKHKEKALISVVRFFHPVFTEPKDLNKKSQDATFAQSENKALPKNKISNENLVQIPTSKPSPQTNTQKESEVIILNNETEVFTVEDSPEKELVPPGTEITSKNIVVNPVAISAARKSNEINDTQKDSLINKTKQKTDTTGKNITGNINLNVENNKQSFEKKEFSAKKNDDVEGFVGVEYVIKVIKHATDNDPRFECCLCETELNSGAMQHHLKGLIHRTKYLERHFPTCMKQFKEYKENSAAMYQIIERICKAIEKYHGRDLPLECVQNDFRANRCEYMEKVFSFRHASEMSGPSFTNIVDKKELQNIINNKTFKIPEKKDEKITFTVRDNESKANYPFTTESDNRPTAKVSNIPTTRLSKNPSRNFPTHPNIIHQHHHTPYRPIFDPSIPNNILPFETMGSGYQNTYTPTFYPEVQLRPNIQYQPVVDQSLDDEEHRRLAENFIKNTKMNDKSDRYRQKSRSPRRYKKQRSRSGSRSRYRRETRSLSRSPLREGDVWQAYRRKYDMDVKIIDMDFKHYQKDPQSYPLYNDEWQSFWANRVNELKQAGRDYQNYDFTYEWSLYFPKRLDELYEKETEALKVRLRERFVLPMHNHELRDPKYHIKHVIEAEVRPPVHPEISIIKNDSKVEGDSPSIKNSRTQAPTRHMSPINISKRKNNSSDMLSVEYENVDSNKEDTFETTYAKKRKRVTDSKSPSPPEVADDLEGDLEKDSITAMSVLRVLTALEDNLGSSLGPKIIDLMSKALVLEKTKPNAVDENLLTTDNCLLLETCREKLKGQIVAGLYKSQQLRAVKSVIKNITTLAEKASVFRAKNPEKSSDVQAILKKATASVAPPKFSSAPRPPAKAITSKVSSHSVPNSRASNQSTNSGSDNITSSVSSNSGSNSANSKQLNIPMMSMGQKKELAKKLAQALAAQGKTDISTESCEQLIEVYTLIDKKQRENGKLNSQEKSLSECLQDCVKSGSLTTLTSIIQDKNKAAMEESSQQPHQEQQQQHSQFGDMTSQVQSILMAINQNRFPQQQSRSNFGNFSHLANFDTSLNFNPVLQLPRPSYRGTSSGSNLTSNSGSQNWVQGSILTGGNYNNIGTSSNPSPNLSSFGNSFSASNNETNNQTNRNLLNNDLNSNNPFMRNMSSGGSWQRSNLPPQQQNNFQNSYGAGSLYERYNRR
ncbi:uncharacterized protein LOC129612629 [Condylostylus longicornis]|uniref:uncharacterized protein LOC129612629 n=1 Tax=Condylostylus longicornis TaxID=2530218 RepID=UPI00244DAE60|nr:uncharacterized protein LOC129612629 [Condylostylus longicornis]